MYRLSDSLIRTSFMLASRRFIKPIAGWKGTIPYWDTCPSGKVYCRFKINHSTLHGNKFFLAYAGF